MWRHDAAPFDLKKRIVRAVIKEIVVYAGAAALRVLVHWQGGQHTELNLRKRKVGEHRWKTADFSFGIDLLFSSLIAIRLAARERTPHV